MANKVKIFVRKFIEAIFPSKIKCVFCGEELFKEEYVCKKCEKDLPYIRHYCLKCGTIADSDGEYCLLCKNQNREFTLARAPFIYENRITNLVKCFKYDGQKYLAEYMASEMVEVYKQSNFVADIIVFIPLFVKRERKRGFNQSKILADEISKLINVKISNGNLVREKNTITQTKLSYNDRQENMAGAFKVLDKSEFKDKNILLVDDIFTTGATMNSACMELKKAGVNKIMCLSFAHTDKRDK